jgi:molybdopterin/thiamine biosynthesis adenylyltransferase
MNFQNFKLSNLHHLPSKNESSYMERTKRNHHWLGGVEGQRKLRNMRIGIAGLGGMGSNIAEIMLRLGVGAIKIADPDTIDFSNINRQVIANSHTVGVKKAHASFKELIAIADDTEVVAYDQGITKENVDEFVSDVDVIIDEIDVFPMHAHVLLHKAARARKLPIYSSYIIGLGTHVYKFLGDEYTFEDFMKNNLKELEAPSADFLVNTFCHPFPSYLESSKSRNTFIDEVKKAQVPIFGATTYMGQSMLAIRVIVDFLKLQELHGPTKTPVMPEFIKIDPYDLSMRICNATANLYNESPLRI